MNFINLVDLIQVFANEYCNPSSIVLLIGNESVNDIKLLFQFINSDVIVVDTQPHQDVDILTTVSFLKETCDLIICLKEFENTELYRILKPGGYMIISTENASSWCNIFASIYFTFVS